MIDLTPSGTGSASSTHHLESELTIFYDAFEPRALSTSFLTRSG